MVGAGEPLRQILAEAKPDLLLLDPGLKQAGRRLLEEWAAQRDCPVLELTGQLQLRQDGLPADVLAIHEALQERLAGFTRRELRINLRLPTLIENGSKSQLGQLLNLGTGGLLLRNCCRHAAIGDTVEMVVPLLGMQQELELTGRVLHLHEASQENGFCKGLGISFQGCDSDKRAALFTYIRMVLENDDPDPVEVYGLNAALSVVSVEHGWRGYRPAWA
jgi:Tfp pilus assembly protein PilZ